MNCTNCGAELDSNLMKMFNSKAVIIGNFRCGACGHSIAAKSNFSTRSQPDSVISSDISDDITDFLETFGCLILIAIFIGGIAIWFGYFWAGIGLISVPILLLIGFLVGKVLNKPSQQTELSGFLEKEGILSDSNEMISSSFIEVSTKPSKQTIESTKTLVETREFDCCPNCRSLQLNYEYDANLAIFQCSCGMTYCDNCSGGGLISLPRCPKSPYHENLRKVGFVQLKPNVAQPEINDVSKTSQNSTEESEKKAKFVKKFRMNFQYKETSKPEEVVKIIFDDALIQLPILPKEQIEQFYNSWSNNRAIYSKHKISWNSPLFLRDTLMTKLQTLCKEDNFEIFRIEGNKRWFCLLLKSLYKDSYGKREKLLLIWRGENNFALVQSN